MRREPRRRQDTFGASRFGAERAPRKRLRETFCEHNQAGEHLQIFATQIATQLGRKGRDWNRQGTTKNARSADKMGLSGKEQNGKGGGSEDFKTGALNRSATPPYTELSNCQFRERESLDNLACGASTHSKTKGPGASFRGLQRAHPLLGGGWGGGRARQFRRRRGCVRSVDKAAGSCRKMPSTSGQSSCRFVSRLQSWSGSLLAHGRIGLVER